MKKLLKEAYIHAIKNGYLKEEKTKFNDKFYIPEMCISSSKELLTIEIPVSEGKSIFHKDINLKSVKATMDIWNM